MTTLNNQSTQEVFESLTLNIKLSQDLLDLLKNESEALKNMDPQELLTLSKQKGILLSKIQYIDNSLKNYLGDTASPPGVSHPSTNSHKGSVAPENSCLTSLIDLLPEEKKSAARQCKEKLTKIRQDTLIQNYINKKFTEDTLGYLGDAISLFTQPVSKKSTYTMSGKSPIKSATLPQMLSTEV